MFTKGDVVRIIATFTDSQGNLTDPTSVTATVRAPNGTVTTPTATKVSTGVYRADVATNASGPWLYRFESTGSAQAAAEGEFHTRSVF